MKLIHLALAATAIAAPVVAATMTLDQVIAGSHRSAANKARDQYRHPKQTLEFFGIKPGDTVIEITPGGGWYTEILAPLMKGNGTYIAAVAKPTRPDGEAATDKAKLEQRFAADADFDARRPAAVARQRHHARRTRENVETSPNDRAASQGSAEHRRDADDVQ